MIWKKNNRKSFKPQPVFCALEEYLLLSPDGSNKFQLKSYKEELGKPYSQLVIFLCSTSEFDNVSCGAIEFNADLKLSLPGTFTNNFDKFF